MVNIYLAPHLSSWSLPNALRPSSRFTSSMKHSLICSDQGVPGEAWDLEWWFHRSEGICWQPELGPQKVEGENWLLKDVPWVPHLHQSMRVPTQTKNKYPATVKGSFDLWLQTLSHAHRGSWTELPIEVLDLPWSLPCCGCELGRLAELEPTETPLLSVAWSSWWGTAEMISWTEAVGLHVGCGPWPACPRWNNKPNKRDQKVQGILKNTKFI